MIAAILVGGRAERMGGAAKPLLEVGGARIVERQIALLAPRCAEVLLVGADDRYAGLPARAVPDRRPGCGPLGGLEAALVEGGDAVLLVGGDMPLLVPALVDRLLAARDADAVVPFVGGFPEPLLARYAGRLRDRVAARLDRGERALHGILDGIDLLRIEEEEVRSLDPDLRSFWNVNTPADLERIRHAT
jgi:molybdopterin-guanine dinucleotide biosynthesis protein A